MESGKNMETYHQSVFEPWPFEDESIQAIITSPPYYALRKYSILDTIIGGDAKCEHEFEIKPMQLRDKSRGPGPNSILSKKSVMDSYESTRGISNGFCIHCGAWKGQYGLERSYLDYISHTRLWAKEAWRVLRDDGIFFLNLADSYHGSGKSDGCSHTGKLGMPVEQMPKGSDFKGNYYKDKCRYMIPERVAIGLIEDGWLLRNHIIWAASNKMPESVKDRFAKKHESIFMFTKSSRYYFNLDAVREPHAQVSIERLQRAVSNSNKWVNGADGQAPHGLSQPRPNNVYKARGKVYASQMEYRKELWEERGVDSSYQFSKEKRQTKIEKDEAEMYGSPRARNHRATRKINDDHDYKSRGPERHVNEKGKNPSDVWMPPPDDSESELWTIPTQPSSEKHYAMWPQSLCRRMILSSTKAGDTVLDPFAGSGTTLRVADELNRIGLGIDLGYSDIQKRRLTEIQKSLLEIV